MGAFGQTEGMPSFVLGCICLRGGATQERVMVFHTSNTFFCSFFSMTGSCMVYLPENTV